MNITPDDLTKASYNPRIMSKKAKHGLRESMDSFNDISGITYNKNTGNIVGGHHRWDNIVSEHGLDHLVFIPIKKTDRQLICTKERKFTGYILRVVDWDEMTEKAANITANSPSIEGEFTNDLQDILAELEIGLDESLFGGVRLDDLKIDLKPAKVDKKPDAKSETAISTGGETHKLVKLELSLELAERFKTQLVRFNKKAGNGAEKTLEVILNFLEAHDDDTILKHTVTKRRKRRA